MEQKDAASEKDEPVPWDELPSDAVSLIASKYTSDAAKYISLHLVSRHWRRSLTEASPNPRLLSPQLPFLLVPPRFVYPCEAIPRLGKIFRVPSVYPGHAGPMIDDLPQFKNTEGSICVGSSHGWLITLDQDSTVSLLNPVTADKICLNTLSTIDDTSLSFDRDSYPEYHLKGNGVVQKPQTQLSIVRRAILSSDPAEDSNFTLLLFISGLTDRCFTLCGKYRKWSSHKHLPFLVKDVIFINGLFIAIDPLANQSVNLVFFDFRSNKSEPVIKRYKVSLQPSSKKLFLVNSDGRLLIISSNSPRTIQYINVREYPFNGDPRVQEWDMKELNDIVLFLGRGCSVSVPVRHFTYLRNKLFTTQVDHVIAWCEKDWRRKTGRCAPGPRDFATLRKSEVSSVMEGLENGAEKIWVGHHGVVCEQYISARLTGERSHIHLESSRYADHWAAPRPFWVTPNINRYSETKSLSDSFDKSVKVV